MGTGKSSRIERSPWTVAFIRNEIEIKLRSTQIAQIEEIFKDMKTRAVRLGTQLVEHERALDRYFLKGNFSTVKILTAQRLKQYNALRGYFDADDPCLNIPAGHNAKMWKKHNNCD